MAIFVYLDRCCNTRSGNPALAPRPVTGLVVTQSPGGWFHAGGRLNELKKNARVDGDVANCVATWHETWMPQRMTKKSADVFQV